MWIQTKCQVLFSLKNNHYENKINFRTSPATNLLGSFRLKEEVNEMPFLSLEDDSNQLQIAFVCLLLGKL